MATAARIELWLAGCLLLQRDALIFVRRRQLNNSEIQLWSVPGYA
jgi:hypothetical protein